MPSIIDGISSIRSNGDITYSKTSNEYLKGRHLSTSLTARFFNPVKNKRGFSAAPISPIYSVNGTDQSVIITYKDFNREMITDTLFLPWKKKFKLNLDPGKSFRAILKVRSLSQKEETLNASIRKIKQTKTGKNLKINLSNNLAGNFTSTN